eukprot:scaffold412_cov311-Pavlova_lutheri.AAC.29
MERTCGVEGVRRRRRNRTRSGESGQHAQESHGKRPAARAAQHTTAGNGRGAGVRSTAASCRVVRHDQGRRTDAKSRQRRRKLRGNAKSAHESHVGTAGSREGNPARAGTRRTDRKLRARHQRATGSHIRRRRIALLRVPPARGCPPLPRQLEERSACGRACATKHTPGTRSLQESTREARIAPRSVPSAAGETQPVRVQSMRSAAAAALNESTKNETNRQGGKGHGGREEGRPCAKMQAGRPWGSFLLR